jgi:multidrug resistance efflux pump
MTRRSKILTWGLPVLGLTALGAGGVMVIENAPSRPAERPPRQPTTAPSAAGLTAAQTFIGSIGITEPPGEAVQIGAHSAGIVEAVLVAPGDRVRRGDPLFRVDTRLAERDVALRASDVALAEAQVTALRGTIPTARAQLAAAQATVAAAEARVASAEADVSDRENLLRIARSVDDPRAIAAEEVDNRRFAVQIAQAAVAQARAGVAQARAEVAAAEASLALLVDPVGGVDGPDIAAAESAADRARADLARARTELDLRTVRSTIDGEVLQVNIRPGEFAPAKELTEGLLVLAHGGPTHIRAQIDEVDIPRFRVDASAWASPRGDASRRIPVTIAYVEPLVVPKRNLSGRTSELVDTRVMEVVYTVGENGPALPFGQQMDLYIEAEPIGGGS